MIKDNLLVTSFAWYYLIKYLYVNHVYINFTKNILRSLMNITFRFFFSFVFQLKFLVLSYPNKKYLVEHKNRVEINYLHLFTFCVMMRYTVKNEKY